MSDEVHATWNAYWLVWFVVTFPLGFLVPEIIALCTDWRRTLSASVWDIEDFVPGQPISHWSAGHFLFDGVMVVLFTWLTLHFSAGWFR